MCTSDFSRYTSLNYSIYCFDKVSGIVTNKMHNVESSFVTCSIGYRARNDPGDWQKDLSSCQDGYLTLTWCFPPDWIYVWCWGELFNDFSGHYIQRLILISGFRLLIIRIWVALQHSDEVEGYYYKSMMFYWTELYMSKFFYLINTYQQFFYSPLYSTEIIK